MISDRERWLCWSGGARGRMRHRPSVRGAASALSASRVLSFVSCLPQCQCVYQRLTPTLLYSLELPTSSQLSTTVTQQQLIVRL